MSLTAVKVLEIKITNNSKKDILEEIRKYLVGIPKKRQKPLIIFTPNTEQLVLAQHNEHFKRVLNNADIAIPDTISLVWSARLFAQNGPTTAIPGVEFMEDLVAMASKLPITIGLIGGRDKIAVKTLDCLQKKYPRLKGWAVDGPEFSGEGELGDVYIEGYIQRIKDSGVGIVFVALGAPKQEFFIEKIAPNLSNVVIMAVGGSFDILSGRLPRAPVLFRTLGLEWLWRLILEPWRWRRQLALIEFIYLVLEKIIKSSIVARR